MVKEMSLYGCPGCPVHGWLQKGMDASMDGWMDGWVGGGGGWWGAVVVYTKRHWQTRSPNKVQKQGPQAVVSLRVLLCLALSVAVAVAAAVAVSS